MIIFVYLHIDNRVAHPGKLGELLNIMSSRFREADWRQRNRNARLSENPDSWDYTTLDSLEKEYEDLCG